MDLPVSGAAHAKAELGEKKLRLILDSKKADDGVRRYRVVQAGA